MGPNAKQSPPKHKVVRLKKPLRAWVEDAAIFANLANLGYLDVDYTTSSPDPVAGERSSGGGQAASNIANAAGLAADGLTGIDASNKHFPGVHFHGKDERKRACPTWHIRCKGFYDKEFRPQPGTIATPVMRRWFGKIGLGIPTSLAQWNDE